MSQGSYSFTRTLSAKRAHQDTREYARRYTYEALPLMAEPAPREKVSLVVEQLPDFGMWAIAYTADAGVKELPLRERYFFVQIPGIRRKVKRGIAYS